MERRSLTTLLAIVAVLPGLACVSGGMRQLEVHKAHDSYAYASRAVQGRFESPNPAQLAAIAQSAAPPWTAGAAPGATLNGCDPSWPLVPQLDGTTICQPPAGSPATEPATIATIEITAAPAPAAPR